MLLLSDHGSVGQPMYLPALLKRHGCTDAQMHAHVDVQASTRCKPERQRNTRARVRVRVRVRVCVWWGKVRGHG